MPTSSKGDADRPGQRRLDEPHRDERAALLDDHARDDRDADARGGHAQHAVHLRAFDRERRMEAGALAGGDRRAPQVVAVAEHDERNAPQVAHPHRAALRERMALRDGEHELLLQ